MLPRDLRMHAHAVRRQGAFSAPVPTLVAIQQMPQIYVPKMVRLCKVWGHHRGGLWFGRFGCGGFSKISIFSRFPKFPKFPNFPCFLNLPNFQNFPKLENLEHLGNFENLVNFGWAGLGWAGLGWMTF